MSKQSQYFLFPDENLKTSQIWKEAGFCPPMPIANLIETLHTSGESGITLTQPFGETLFHSLSLTCRHPEEEYHIYNTSRLKEMAELCNIPVKDQDIHSVAQEIAKSILRDYGVYTTKNCRESDIL